MMMKAPTALNGPRGLILAILARSYLDLQGNDKAMIADALAFYGSDDYIRYLELAGIHPDMFPELREVYDDEIG